MLFHRGAIDILAGTLTCLENTIGLAERGGQESRDVNAWALVSVGYKYTEGDAASSERPDRVSRLHRGHACRYRRVVRGNPADPARDDFESPPPPSATASTSPAAP